MSQIIVDTTRRYALMRSHTATHLLHAALCEIFPQTKQAGSYVGEDELRFDFFAERLLDQTELNTITTQINDTIRHHHLVTVTEMSYGDAIQSGAKAFFEDKYPEKVRVVKVHDSKSVELCGGTHVSQTNEIGAFIILEQSAVAAGVKRISALTGPRVAHYTSSLVEEKNNLADKVGVPAKQLDTKIDKFMNEHTESQKTLETIIKHYISGLSLNPGSLGDTTLSSVRCIDNNSLMQTIGFTAIVGSLRNNNIIESRLLYNTSGQYALFHPQAKEITKNLALKGGGSDNFVQGRDEKVGGLLK